MAKKYLETLLTEKELKTISKIPQCQLDIWGELKVLRNQLIGYSTTGRGDTQSPIILENAKEIIATFKISTNRKTLLVIADRIVVDAEERNVVFFEEEYMTHNIAFGQNALELSDGSRTTMINHEKRLIIAPNKMGSWIGKGGSVIRAINKALKANYKVVKEENNG